ncbi:MAG: ion transporter [Oscillatoriaceae cyanobacterium Prado104]|jgi:voltage-gated potassium channel|nr:ion transporter [Oscillatoriaceae cyanobacterium Prado104]
MHLQIKRTLYTILNTSDSKNLYSFADDIIVTFLIVLNIAAFIASTESLPPEKKLIVEGIEIVSSLLFTLEYGLRMWVCTLDRHYAHPIWGRLKYAITPLSIIDLVSILPFYLLLLFPGSNAFNLISLLRLLRLLKISRYSESVRHLGLVLYRKKDELIATAFAVFILLIFASSLMYFVEYEAHPDVFGSILDAMWWGVVTLTTVGYGDIYPITPLGRFLGAILAFLGMGIFALPAGIIASGFAEEVQRKKQERIVANLERTAKIQATPILGEIEVNSNRQPREITLYVENSADLMKLCIDTAKQKFGTAFESEEIIRDLAMHLYNEAQQKFPL